MKNEIASEIMDFLLNYGWVIILIILVVAAIFSLGIYNIPPILGK